MSGLSDIITLGLVLILVFGSVCLYLYTRIQQAETKINLLESILLDLKMTNELKSYPTLSSSIPALESDHMFADTIYKSSPEPIIADTAVQVKPFVDNDDEDLAPGSTVGYTESVTSPAPVQAPSQIPDESGVKVVPNYEAMTLKELRDIAKERKLHGVSTLKRSELIDLLKQSDNKHNGLSMFESMAVSDIANNAEEFAINA